MNKNVLVQAIVNPSKSPAMNKKSLLAIVGFGLFGLSHTACSEQGDTNQTKLSRQYAAGENWRPSEAQSSKSTPTKFGAPYPFTADQLREMLLKVAAIKKVSEDGAEILEIFQLPRDEFLHAGAERLLAGVKGYSITAGKNWYLNMFFHFHEKSHDSRFNFSWGDDPAKKRAQLFPRPPAGLCIKAQTLTEQLKLLKWQLKEKTNILGLPPMERYNKDDFVGLQLLYSRVDNCILEFSFSWNASVLRDAL